MKKVYKGLTFDLVPGETIEDTDHENVILRGYVNMDALNRFDDVVSDFDIPLYNSVKDVPATGELKGRTANNTIDKNNILFLAQISFDGNVNFNGLEWFKIMDKLNYDTEKKINHILKNPSKFIFKASIFVVFLFDEGEFKSFNDNFLKSHFDLKYRTVDDDGDNEDKTIIVPKGKPMKIIINGKKYETIDKFLQYDLFTKNEVALKNVYDSYIHAQNEISNYIGYLTERSEEGDRMLFMILNPSGDDTIDLGNPGNYTLSLE